MKLNRLTGIILLVFSAAIALSSMSCNITPTQPERPILPFLPLDSTNSQPPVYTIVDSEPRPADGKSNTKGNVRWAGKGIKGVEVLLCDRRIIPGIINLQNPSLCQGKAIKTKTDADGNYLFREMSPGKYAIAIKTSDSKGNYLILTEKTFGISASMDIPLEKNQTTEILTQNIWKTDLNLISPKSGQVLQERLPVLKWQDYPDVKRYSVSLKFGGQEITVTEKGNNNYVPANELSDGWYDWEVTAYGENDEVFAKNKSNFHIGVVKKVKKTSGGIGTGSSGK